MENFVKKYFCIPITAVFFLHMFNTPVCCGSQVPGRVIVIDDFESLRGWGTGAGDAAPLPTGGMKLVTGNAHGGKSAGSFFFDTTNRGYVTSGLAQVFPPEVRAIRFWTRPEGRVELLVRLVDASGQTHQISLPQEKGDWRQVVLQFDKPWPGHFQGKDDGLFHQPFRSIQFLRHSGSDPAKGTILIDDLEAVTTAPEDQLSEYAWNNQEITFTTQVPGNLFYPGDKVEAKLAVRSFLPEKELTATINVFDVGDKKVTETAPIKIKPDGTAAVVTGLSGDLNYYWVMVRVTDGKRVSNIKSRYAVIPANPALGKKEPESPFGVNTHFNQGWPVEIGKIVKRAGIAWIRDGEATPDDLAIFAVLENQLCYLPCFTYWRAELTERFKKAMAKNKQADLKPLWADAVQWHRQYALKYGKEIDYYDLMNEPHGSWSAVFGGSWWGGEWLKPFAAYGREVTQAIQSADPGAKIVWEDIDRLLWYKDWGKYGAAGAVGVISPHTYNLHLTNPFPEDQPVLKDVSGFREFCRREKVSWPVWSGEVGFSSFQRDKGTGSPFYSPNTEPAQADNLVRMMVVQLAAGVEKIFWYDFMNDGWEANNPEHNFGLIRNDRLPKPAVAAYANLISRLRGIRRLDRYVIGGGAEAYVFVGQKSEHPTLIGWVRQSAQKEEIPVFSQITQVTISDIYGHGRKVAVTNHRLVLELSTSPVYVDGLTPTDVAALVEKQ
jgi:hypothetical protein